MLVVIVTGIYHQFYQFATEGYTQNTQPIALPLVKGTYGNKWTNNTGQISLYKNVNSKTGLKLTNHLDTDQSHLV